MKCIAAAACLALLLASEASVYTPSLASWRIDPDDIVAADAHIRWSEFVPMDDTSPGEAAFPELDWKNLKNPILASKYGAIKNQAVLYHQGWFWIFPMIEIEEGAVLLRTRDFKTYEYHKPGILMGDAPRLLAGEGIWHASFQLSAPDADRRIYYSSSNNLVDWAEPEEAWAHIQPGTRHIDAALAKEGGHYFAGFKSRQRFYVMRSVDETLDFQWEEPVEAHTDGWCEAYQFIKIDGQWRMVATARAPRGFDTGGNFYTGSHEPFIYTMKGDGSEIEHWAHWTDKRHIALPSSDWNQVMRANAAYLCDWREHDGWFYLFFSGANDDTLARGRGHCKIGVARSRDLVKWYLPGELE